MPITPENRDRERANFLEDVEWLVDSGIRERELLATRLGLTIDTFERRLQRWDRPDLVARTYRYSEVPAT